MMRLFPGTAERFVGASVKFPEVAMLAVVEVSLQTQSQAGMPVSSACTTRE